MTVATGGDGIAVLGAGAWGTALAVHAARAGSPVMLWARSAEFGSALAAERVNERYLPGVELPAEVRVTWDLRQTSAYGTVLVVVPSHGFRAVVRSFLEARRGLGDGAPLPERVTFVSGTKGIESDHRGGFRRMSDVCREEASSAGMDIDFATISGPSFAAELAAELPTACVVAAESAPVADRLQAQLSAGALRLYTSTDVIGVEIAAAAKNVIAIAAGVLDGLRYGSNTRAALITRGLHEMMRLGLACGGRAPTFAGLGGLGDLVLTCTGGLSRNRNTGIELARGRSLEEIEADRAGVAEGVRNSLALLELATEKEVELPITEQMVEILYRGKKPAAAIGDLMRREPKVESAL